MPLVKFLCKTCSKHFPLFFRKFDKYKDSKQICECGGEAHRILSAPSQKSTIMVDNGLQSRAVELNMEVVESNREQSKKDYNRGD